MNAELTREPNWWHDLSELAEFGRWLTRNGTAPLDVWEVVEFPERWDSEHTAFVRECELERLADEEEAYVREGRYS